MDLQELQLEIEVLNRLIDFRDVILSENANHVGLKIPIFIQKHRFCCKCLIRFKKRFVSRQKLGCKGNVRLPRSGIVAVNCSNISPNYI